LRRHYFRARGGYDLVPKLDKEGRVQGSVFMGGPCVERTPRPTRGDGADADSMRGTVRLGDKRKRMTPIGGSHQSARQGGGFD
jgi:hypothetical protein